MIQGAMTVEEMRELQVNPLTLARAWGEVAGHLQTAELALRAATPYAIHLAQTRRVPRTTPASTGILETKR